MSDQEYQNWLERIEQDHLNPHQALLARLMLGVIKFLQDQHLEGKPFKEIYQALRRL